MKMNGNRKGFSMVEVLVASTILIVIVMMMAMLFQQTSVAWRTGLMRARGYMQLRSYIGAVQRDASTAIDAKNLPKRILDGKSEQTFSDSRISFYTLSGKDDERTLKFITHDTSGKRTESVLSLNGNGQWEPESSSEVLKFLTESGANDPEVNPQRFGFKWTDGPEYGPDGKSIPNLNRFPLYITLDAEIVQKGKLYGVGAASAGPDMKWDTKDDIRTWVE